MELSLSTFILELINFLVLVWILKHFLYRPVLDIIAKRRASIDQTMAEAKRIEDDAQALKQQYDERLDKWQQEQRAARETLAHELDDERALQLAALQQTLEQNAEKARVSETRRLDDLKQEFERQGLSLGARFAARLLETTATPELQARLLARFLDDFDAAPRESILRLLGSPDLPPDEVVITSAFTLDDEQRRALAERAGKLCREDTPIRFDEDPSLLAGVRLTIGGCILGLNLKDELEGFAKVHDVAA